MPKKGSITRISSAELGHRKSLTDWRRVRSLTDTEIRHAVKSDPDQSMADANFWKTARLVVPVPKERVGLRLDRDVMAYFRGQGRGYQTRINAVLRAYMEAHPDR